MSAAVDTLKERVYCLETVLKLEPGHQAARPGLVMAGALPPDKNVKPFQIGKVGRGRTRSTSSSRRSP